MVLFERQSDASWMPTAVILATPKRLQGKCLPGTRRITGSHLTRIENGPDGETCW
jgi:hypothetical protein